MIDIQRIKTALNKAPTFDALPVNTGSSTHGETTHELQQTIQNSSSSIVVKRYMIEVSTYPNGNEYIRAWCCFTGEKKNTPKKKKEKKVLDKVKIEKVEEY